MNIATLLLATLILPCLVQAKDPQWLPPEAECTKANLGDTKVAQTKDGNSLVVCRGTWKPMPIKSLPKAGDPCTKDQEVAQGAKGELLVCMTGVLVENTAPRIGDRCWAVVGRDGQAVDGADGKVVCRAVGGHGEFRPVGESTGVPVPGTAEAARAMVPLHLGKLYTVVDEPVLHGDEATVHAKLLDMDCNLSLVRHPAANDSGWAVKEQDCRRPAAKGKSNTRNQSN